MSDDTCVPSLERCLGYWKAFDLTSRVEALTKAGTEIVARQEEAKAARTSLTERYKAWRRVEAPDDRLAGVIDLIKEFQGNDDQLQKRAKAAEVGFASLLKELLEAPDPSVPLAYALETARECVMLKADKATLQAEVASLRVQAATAAANSEKADEVQRLQKEVQELEAELSTLSNQDITIRQLEQRLEELEGSLDEQVSSSLSSKEAELRSAFEAELEHVREAEAAAEARVAALTATMHDAQLARDEAQAALYTVRARAEEDVASLRAETEAAVATSERANRQVALLTASVEEWKRKAAEASHAAENGTVSAAAAAKAAQVDSLRSRAEAAEDECARLSSTVSSLQEENRRWASLADRQRATQERAVADVKAEVVGREAEVIALRTELASRPTSGDMAELRRQLTLLQAVHFGSSGDDGGSQGPGSSTGVGVGVGTADGTGQADGAAVDGGSGDIHSIMLRRIRQLEGRALRAEADKASAVGEVDKLRTDLAAAQEALEEQRGMVAQLDQLLSGRMRGGLGGPLPSAPSLPSPTKSSGDAGLAPAGMGSGAAASGGDADTSGAQLGAILNSSTDVDSIDGSASSSSAALAAVLRGQRDKFRARVLELEQETNTQAGKVAQAAERAAKLQSDNVRLYEKIRYLQSALQASQGIDPSDTRIVMGSPAGSGGGGGGGGARARQTGARGAELLEEQPFEAEYAKAYKDTLLDSLQMLPGGGGGGSNSSGSSDPLLDFRSREKVRTFNRMSTGEKLTVTGSRLFLANKVWRRAALMYAACLHLLVFSTMMHFANTTHGAAEACMGLGGGAAALGRPDLGARASPQ